MSAGKFTKIGNNRTIAILAIKAMQKLWLDSVEKDNPSSSRCNQMYCVQNMNKTRNFLYNLIQLSTFK